jgi:hypothetical protein
MDNSYCSLHFNLNNNPFNDLDPDYITKQTNQSNYVARACSMSTSVHFDIHGDFN